MINISCIVTVCDATSSILSLTVGPYKPPQGLRVKRSTKALVRI